MQKALRVRARWHIAQESASNYGLPVHRLRK
jgi:hypothetical protein